MNILFDLIFLKFYLHRWVAKKPNVKVLAYRILNSQIENHIKIKLDFYLSSQVSESKLGHLNILCRLEVFRGPGETQSGHWPGQQGRPAVAVMFSFEGSGSCQFFDL